jgi:hypothetical protein
MGYLYDAVKHVDLRAFVAREAGANFEQKAHDNWVSICPLHRDSKPSFSVTRNHNGIWVCHCFGCQFGGTIIDFAKELLGLSTAKEAAIAVAEREGIKFDESLIVKAMNEAKIQTDMKHDLDMAHFNASLVCRKLLQLAGNDEQVMIWVAKAYQRMNKLLDDETVSPSRMAAVGREAWQKLSQLRLAKEAI